MSMPINNPVPIIVEETTRDRIAAYKVRGKFGLRNMDSVINKFIDLYEENK